MGARIGVHSIITDDKGNEYTGLSWMEMYIRSQEILIQHAEARLTRARLLLKRMKSREISCSEYWGCSFRGSKAIGRAKKHVGGSPAGSPVA